MRRAGEFIAGFSLTTADRTGILSGIHLSRDQASPEMSDLVKGELI